MNARLLGLGVAAGVAAFTLPAHAAGVAKAPKPVVITDPTGDTNMGAPVPEASGDLTKLSLQSTFAGKKALSGSTITLTTAAAPDSDHFYAIEFTTTGACKDLELIYDTNAVPVYAQQRAACADTTPSTTVDGATAKVVGNNLVWTVPTSLLPAGTTLTDITARVYHGVVPIGLVDDIPAGAASFTVGK